MRAALGAGTIEAYPATARGEPAAGVARRSLLECCWHNSRRTGAGSWCSVRRNCRGSTSNPARQQRYSLAHSELRRFSSDWLMGLIPARYASRSDLQTGASPKFGALVSAGSSGCGGTLRCLRKSRSHSSCWWAPACCCAVLGRLFARSILDLTGTHVLTMQVRNPATVSTMTMPDIRFFAEALEAVQRRFRESRQRRLPASCR